MPNLSHRLVLVPFVALGCSEPRPPIEYETEHLRIGSTLEAPLCEGDLARFESLIDDIESELNLEMKEKATLYIWDEESWWSGANSACRSKTYGCYDQINHTIDTTTLALEHEIVHAVVGGDNVGIFFEEAIAEVYSGEQSQFGETAPSANVDISRREDMDYKTANHFLRWLREKWGGEKIGELLRSSSSGSKAFKKVYGMTIEEAELLYYEESPYHYTSLYSCEGASLRQAPSMDHWQEEIPLDCPSGDDTHAAGIGMQVHRTFEISEAGHYTVQHDGYWFDIYRCSPTRVEDAFHLNTHLYDDVPPEHDSFPSAADRHYEGKSSWSLYMEAGLHDIGVGILGHDVGTVTLEISPTLGPYPVPPN